MASQEEIRLQRENNELLREQNELLKQRRGTNEDTLDDLRSFSNLLQDQTKQIQFQVSEKRQLRSISNQILKISQESFSGLESELGTQNNINSIIKQRQSLQKSIINLESLKNKFTEGDAELNVNINKSIQDQIEAAAKLNQELKKQQQTSEKIANNFGVKTFGALSDITKKIPGLSRFSEPFQDAAEAARSAASTNLGIDKFKKLRQEGVGIKDALNQAGVSASQVKLGKTQPFLAGVKSLGPALTKALGPLVLLKELVDAFLQSDKIIGDMAKGLNMSYTEALSMKQELTAAANESGSIFVTSKGMAETLMEINKTLGTNVMLNKEDLATFTELRTVAGFTNDELMGIQSLSLATGKSLEDNTKEFMAQAKISAIQNGVLLNEKELTKDIKNISAATTLSFSNNPKLLAEAVATTKALGMEMSKVEAIADSLLNFEQSIENELQAELLLGKNINLEKARQAALNNDLTTVAKEIAKQAGDSAEFGKMNRIQQEALASAVGMSREELAKTLYIQDQLAGATGKQAEEKEKILNARIQEVGLAQAQREMEEKGFEGLKNQASMQDRFNASIEKLREIFVTVAEAIMPILDVFAGVFNIVGLILKPIGALIEWGNSFGSVMGTIVGLLTAAGIAALVLNSSLTFGVGAAIALAAVGAGMALLKDNETKSKSAGDIISPAKGKTQISTKEGGLFELSPNDDVIAAPGAARAMARATQPQQQPVVVQNDNTESKRTNMLLEQILTKQGTVKIDSTDAGTAFSMGTYKVQ